MSQGYRDEDLAYGDYHERGQDDAEYEGGERGIIGDTFRKLRGRYQQPGQQPYGQSNYSASTQSYQSQQSQSYNQAGAYGQGGGYNPPGGNASYNQPGGAQGPSNYPNPPPKGDLVSSLLGKVHGVVQGLGTEVAQKLGGPTAPGQSQYGQYGGQSMYGQQALSQHRYGSFAAQRNGNEVKWHVDGCAYMYAVSKALENARESIWILDWWLSPELYLRRPPAKNEQYRVDRLLQAAAQRGVRVNVIVYKEVTQALTRISSAHTKHVLESLHPNISVFRHPDHLPDAQTLQSSLVSSLQNLSLNAANVTKLPVDAVKSIYGMSGDVILYWAHHEKLCLVDGRVAFMGGLDLCYGRWDTNQHPIADAHPSNLNDIVFPGQDYNNARIMDFQDVSHWQENKLDRTQSSRMGWSDISISLKGPVIQDLQEHFVERWNFIYDEKYNVRQDRRYSRLTFTPTSFGVISSSGAPQAGLTHQQQYGQVAPQQSYQSSTYGQQQQTQGVPSPQPSGQQFPPPPTSATPLHGTDSSQQHAAQYPPPPTGSSTQQYTPLPTAASTQQFPPPPASSSPYSQPQPTPPSQSQQFPLPPPPPPTGLPSSTQQTYSGSYDGKQHPSPPAGGPLPQSQQSYGGFSGNQPQYGQSPNSPQSSYVELEGSLPTQAGQTQYPPPPLPQQTRGFDEDLAYGDTRGMEGESERAFGFDSQRLRNEAMGIGNMLRSRLGDHLQQAQTYVQGGGQYHRPQSSQAEGAMPCQIVRSCSKWSHGTATEHSIQDAYIRVIQESQHFVYIENQFFITATGNQQQPVKNQIGAALVERIVRAHRSGESYKAIVVMPAIPAFAGDLKDDSSLGTRAIMEFQYNSINRGGHSIMERLAAEGVPNPMEYIRFYNLRNYDRINAGAYMAQVQQRSGVSYEDARRQHDDMVGAGYAGTGERTTAGPYNPGPQYQQWQQQAAATQPPSGGRWDSVSECYMLGGEDIRSVPWDGSGQLSEIEAFVSEELYIHSKVLIADDRVVICGSANLNDRSQLGTHDSEIAIIIEDPTPVDSQMNGRPWRANRFASSLRRQLFRKHLGLIRPQNMQVPDQNFEPAGVPNLYDWGSPEDQIVADPLSINFQNFWNGRAHQNTEVFSKIFHPVPDDKVRNWHDYDEFYGYYFHDADKDADGKEGNKKPAKYKWGHVVQDEFPPGPEGIKQVKEMLSSVRGTLVEMPLMFLIEEDIAKQGVSLNALTEEIYT